MVEMIKSRRYGSGGRFLASVFCGLYLACWFGSAVSPAAASAVFEDPLKNLDNRHKVNSLNAIIQDQHGFIWLGGEGGLGRFDGRSLKFYQAEQGVSASLPSSYIWDIVLDRDQVMWIASTGGLSRYNTKTDDFETFSSVGGNRFLSEATSTVAVDEANNLYVGATRGLHRIDAAREKMQIFVPDPPLARTHGDEHLRDIEITPDGKVWLATAGMGVAIFDPKSDTFEYLLHNPNSSASLVSNHIKTIEVDRLGKVWIGTYGGGISVYDPDTGEFRNHLHDPDRPGGLRSAVVSALLRDSRGVMWATLDHGGLAKFNETSETFEHFAHDPTNPATVASNQLRAIYEDNNGDLWIGAFPSGLSYYNRSKQIFKTYRAKPNDPSSLSYNAVISLFEDSQGIVWVGTEEGLNALDPITGAFEHYRADRKNSEALAAGAVLAIEEDFWGDLWIGTWSGGLHRFDRKTKTFRRYSADETDPSSISSNFVWNILEDRKKRLWIGTEGGGLNRYDRAADRFVSYRDRPNDSASIAGSFVWTTLEDAKGRLWVGTFLNGLDQFDPENEHFHHFPAGSKDGRSISSKHIRSLHEDSRGLVWIGTRDKGVSIYDPKNQWFRYIDIEQGLPASTVSSILEDDHGDMWLATTHGLVRVEYPSLDITTYSEEHGVRGSNFNRNASLKDGRGTLYFGSTEGLTSFNPSQLPTSTAEFPIHLTRFRILNKDVAVGGDSPLQESIVEASEIRLTYKDIMFSFDFAALDYRNPSNHRYAYKLEGFDPDWNYIGATATATYTSIDPGTYKFRVKASNGSGEWNEEGRALTVIVEPPPWRTWWAYMGYAAMAAMAVYSRRSYLRLRSSAQSYKVQSITDPLTGLYNRAGISDITNSLFSSTETRKDTVVLIMDIDHFKRINDEYGHDVGDSILTAIAELLTLNVRRGDYIGRWGGEEFILLCPSATAESASSIAEKLRSTVEASPFDANNISMKVTISVGVAITRPHDTFNAVLKRADIALYKAKSSGRNCVCFADNDLISAHP